MQGEWHHYGNTEQNLTFDDPDIHKPNRGILYWGVFISLLIHILLVGSIRNWQLSINEKRTENNPNVSVNISIEVLKPAAKEAIKSPLPPPAESSEEKPIEKPIKNKKKHPDKAEVSTQIIDLQDPSIAEIIRQNTPEGFKLDNPDNSDKSIFSPLLRKQLTEARRRNSLNPVRRDNYSFINSQGKEVFVKGDKCFTVGDDIDGGGRQWSLPYTCSWVETESDRIMRGLREKY